MNMDLNNINYEELGRIRNNDPGVDDVWLDCDEVTSDVNFGITGNYIGENKCIETITLKRFGEDISYSTWDTFFEGVSHNQSIKELY